MYLKKKTLDKSGHTTSRNTGIPPKHRNTPPPPKKKKKKKKKKKNR